MDEFEAQKVRDKQGLTVYVKLEVTVNRNSGTKELMWMHLDLKGLHLKDSYQWLLVLVNGRDLKCDLIRISHANTEVED